MQRIGKARENTIVTIVLDDERYLWNTISHVDDRQFRKRFPGSRSCRTSSEQLPLISFFLAYRLTIASTMLRNRPVLPRYRSPRLDRPGTMPRSYCSSRKQTHGALVRRERRTTNVHGTSICMIMRTELSPNAEERDSNEERARS